MSERRRRFKIVMEIETTAKRFITRGDIEKDLVERYDTTLPEGGYTRIQKLDVKEIGSEEILKRFWIPIAILLAWIIILVILWLLPHPP